MEYYTKKTKTVLIIKLHIYHEVRIMKIRLKQIAELSVNLPKYILRTELNSPLQQLSSTYLRDALYSLSRTYLFSLEIYLFSIFASGKLLISMDR